MTPAQLRELAASTATTDVVIGGAAFGMGRAKAYAEARAGTFPVPVLKIGSRYRVKTSDLVAALLEPTTQDKAASA